MFGQLGFTELLIILFIVLILFGAGRVSRVGGELGSAIAAFRRGVRDGMDEEKSLNDPNAQPSLEVQIEKQLEKQK